MYVGYVLINCDLGAEYFVSRQDTLRPPFDAAAPDIDIPT